MSNFNEGLSSTTAHLLLENKAFTLPLPHNKLAQGGHTHRYPVTTAVHRHTCDNLQTYKLVL